MKPLLLVTHPRSGSEWFLDCVVDFKYPGWELFGELNRKIADRSPIPRLSLSAKLLMLKSGQAQAHKAHHYVLSRELDDPAKLEGVQLICLRRRNVEAAIFSALIAVGNNLNFHWKIDHLIKPIKPAREQVEGWFQRVYGTFGVGLKLPYTETIWYEDLLSGKLPNTVKLDLSKSSRPIRKSQERFKHLVLNYEEVKSWIDELRQTCPET